MRTATSRAPTVEHRRPVRQRRRVNDAEAGTASADPSEVSDQSSDAADRLAQLADDAASILESWPTVGDVAQRCPAAARARPARLDSIDLDGVERGLTALTTTMIAIAAGSLRAEPRFVGGRPPRACRWSALRSHVVPRRRVRGDRVGGADRPAARYMIECRTLCLGQLDDLWRDPGRSPPATSTIAATTAAPQSCTTPTPTPQQPTDERRVQHVEIADTPSVTAPPTLPGSSSTLTPARHEQAAANGIDGVVLPRERTASTSSATSCRLRCVAVSESPTARLVARRRRAAVARGNWPRHAASAPASATLRLRRRARAARPVRRRSARAGVRRRTIGELYGAISVGASSAA